MGRKQTFKVGVGETPDGRKLYRILYENSVKFWMNFKKNFVTASNPNIKILKQFELVALKRAVYVLNENSGVNQQGSA